MTDMDPREAFIRRYQIENYRHTALVSHRGVIVAFAMSVDEGVDGWPERRLWFSVLDMNRDEAEVGPLDVNHWLDAPREVFFPGEITSVGYGLAEQVQVPKMVRGPQNVPAPVTDPSMVLASEIDRHWSSTSRFSSDLPFQVFSDNKYIYIFRQAVARDEPGCNVTRTDGQGQPILDGQGQPVMTVDRTLLVDRFVLSGTQILPKREIRYRRSRSRTRPEGPKDSLGATDMDGNPFYEPTQQLTFVRNLVDGRFAVVQLPTSVAGVARWQIFACSGPVWEGAPSTRVIDAWSVERSADGLFDTRGTQFYTSPEPQYRSAVFEREPGLCPFTARPLIPIAGSTGYAESALRLDGTTTLTIPASASLELPGDSTLELWVKPDLPGTAETPATLIARENPAEGALVLDEAGRLRYAEGGDGDGIHTVQTTNALPIGVWSHIAVVRTGNYACVFVNGEEVADSSLFPAPTPAVSGLIVGRGLVGTIDELRAWELARSTLELMERRSVRLVGYEPGLVGYWRLDEDGGTTARDQTENANDGSLPATGDPSLYWTTSDAPIGESAGVNRTSFWFTEQRIDGQGNPHKVARAVVGGLSALLYQQSEPVDTSSGTAKPVKRSARVMLAAPTRSLDSEGSDAPYIAILDFGVGRDGRIALVQDAIHLERIESAPLSELLDEIAARQAVLRGHALVLDPAATIPVYATPESREYTSTVLHYADNVAALEQWAAQLALDWQAGLTSAHATLATADTNLAAAKQAHADAKKAEALAQANLDAAQAALPDTQQQVVSTQKTLDARAADVHAAELALKAAVASEDQDSIAQEQLDLETAQEQQAQAAKALTVAQAELTALGDKIADLTTALQESSEATLAASATQAAATDAQASAQAKVDDLTAQQADVAALPAAITQSLDVRVSAYQASLAAPKPKSMKLLHIDAGGLTVTGGRLDFAFTEAPPLLFASSDGNVALYFQGAPDEGEKDGYFFGTYFDTRAERTSLALPDAENPVLRFVSQSTEPENAGSTIEISTITEETCTVTIVHPDPAGGDEPVREQWTGVPRASQRFAEVINGVGDKPVYLGTLASRTSGDISELQLSSSVRRSLKAGMIVEVAGARYTVTADVARAATRIPITATTLGEALPAGARVSWIPYDYRTGLTRSPDPLAYLTRGSAFFLVGAANPEALVDAWTGVCAPVGMLSQWTSAEHGQSLRLDGATTYLGNSAPVEQYVTRANVTMEAWVYPEIVESRQEIGTPTIVYCKSDAPGAIDYGMWLEEVQQVSYRWIFWRWWGWLFRGVPNLADFLAHQLVEDRQTTGYKVVARVGSRMIRTTETLPFGKWNHLAAVYQHRYGLALTGDADSWLDAGRDEALNVTEDLTIEAFVRLDDLARGGLIAKGMMNGVAKDSVPYALRLVRASAKNVFMPGSWQLEFSFQDANGRVQRFESVFADFKAGGFYRIAVVRELVKERVEKDTTMRVDDRDVPMKSVEVDEYHAIKMYVLEGRSASRRIDPPRTVSASAPKSKADKSDFTWQYVVVANNALGHTEASVVAEVQNDASLAADDANVITWEKVEGATGYDVYCLASDRHALAGRIAQLPADATKYEHTGAKGNGWDPPTINTTGSVRRVDAGILATRANLPNSAWGALSLAASGAVFDWYRYEGTTPTGNTAGVQLGRSSDAAGNLVPFKGAFAEVRVWGRALGDREVCADLTPGTNGLRAWWRFQENRGRVVADSAGDNSATWYHASWIACPDPVGPSLTLYRNGVALNVEEVHPSAAPQVGGAAQFSLAGRHDGAPTPNPLSLLRGQLEEVRVWRTVRSQEQIQDNLFTRLRGELTALIAYYDFDSITGDLVHDDSLHGSDLLALPPGAGQTALVPSLAPISNDTAQVRSAFPQIKTDFHDTIEGRPAVQEYGDMQTDADGNLQGVLKRVYSFTRGGVWHLITGYKVGDLKAEWIGQAQFAPQLQGFIEGAPPVPSENLARSAGAGSYSAASKVELVDADRSTLSFTSGQEQGYDRAVETSISGGFTAATSVLVAPLGFGMAFDIEVSVDAGVKSKVGSANTWGAEQSGSSTRELERRTSLALSGAWEDPRKLLNTAIGQRFVPANVGLALVQSQTADVYALRLRHNDALVAFQFRPNPDIPPDWNIIHFPVNPYYTKQGTLDGAVGYDGRGKVLDPAYKNATGYGEYSYFKPREAYALKKRIDHAYQAVKSYYDHYEVAPPKSWGKALRSGAKLASEAARYGVDSTPPDLSGVGGDIDLDGLSRRSLVNTYVWTARGGFFAESTSLSSVRTETSSGSYTLSGELGFNLNIGIEAGVSFNFGLDVATSGSLTETRSKTRESERSFSVNVEANVEGDLQRYDGETPVFDAVGDPVLQPGKVDSYRFMTFFLEESKNNFEDFYNKVVDPIWLEQSGSPDAVALQQARQDAAAPPCWRVFHRVTFVSRVLPDFASPGASPQENAMRTLDINSNYELIQRLDPFVRRSLGDPDLFARAVRSAIRTYMPELLEYSDSIIEFMAQYYGQDTGLGALAQGCGGIRVPLPPLTPTGATTLAELADDDGASHLFTFTGEARGNDIVGTASVTVVETDGDIGGSNCYVASAVPACQGALAMPHAGTSASIQLDRQWGRDHDRTLEIVFRTGLPGAGTVLGGDPEVQSHQRMFDGLATPRAGVPLGLYVTDAAPVPAAPQLAGLDPARIAGKAVYLCLRYTAKTSTLDVIWMVEGDSAASNTVRSVPPGSISGGHLVLGDVQVPGQEARTDPWFELEVHHLAVYPAALGEPRILQRLALLRFAPESP